MEPDLSVEEKIRTKFGVSQGIVDEIRKFFNIIDKDKSGQITSNEISDALVQMTKRPIHQSEVAELQRRLDKNSDNIVSWEEFLETMLDFVTKNRVAGGQFQGEIEMQRTLHTSMKNFFTRQTQSPVFDPDQYDLRFKFCPFEEIPDFVNPAEKYSALENLNKSPEYLRQVIQAIRSAPNESALVSGLLEIEKPFYVFSLFKTPHQRFEIHKYLTEFYSNLIEWGLHTILVSLLLNNKNYEVQTKSLRILGLIASGPSIGNLPNDPIYLQYKPGSEFYKNCLATTGLLDVLLQNDIIKSVSPEVQTQALFLLGSIAQESMHFRVAILQRGTLSLVANLWHQGNPHLHQTAVIRVLAILCGWTMPAREFSGDNCIPEEEVSKMLAILCEDIIDSYYKIGSFPPVLIGLALHGVGRLSYQLRAANYGVLKNLDQCIMITCTSTSKEVLLAGLAALREALSNSSLIYLLLDESCSLLLGLSDILKQQHQFPLMAEKVMDILDDIIAYNQDELLLRHSSDIRKTLLDVMHTENNSLKHRTVRLFHKIIEKRNSMHSMWLIQLGLVGQLFEELRTFREDDLVLMEVYDIHDPNYNFPFLIETLSILCALVSSDNCTNPTYLTCLVAEFTLFRAERLRDFFILYKEEFESKNMRILDLQTYHGPVGQVIKTLLLSWISFLSQSGVTTTAGITSIQLTTLVNRCQETLVSVSDFFERSVDLIRKMAEVYETLRDRQLQICCWHQEGKIQLQCPFISNYFHFMNFLESNLNTSPIHVLYENYGSKIAIVNDDTLMQAYYHSLQKSNIPGNASPSRQLVMNIAVTRPNLLNLLHRPIMMRSYLTERDIIEDIRANSNMSDVEIQKFYQYFMQIRQSRVGIDLRFQAGNATFLTFHEANSLLTTFGFNIQPTALETIFKRLDFGGKSLVGFVDLICFLGLMLKGSVMEKLEVIFEILDQDNNGFIELSELEIFVKNVLMCSNPNVDLQSVQQTSKQLFEAIDLNGDNKISFAEFMAAYTSNTLTLQSFIQALF